MDMHDIRQFIYDGFQTIKNFFRTVVSTARGRELSKVDDGTEKAPIIDAEVKKMNILEGKLDELEIDVARKEDEFKEYLTIKDKSAFVVLELAIDIQKTVNDAIIVCKQLLKDNENTDILEQLHYFEYLEDRYAKIVIALGPKAKQESLDDIMDMFEHEIIIKALIDASEINPHYMENFTTVQKHLTDVDNMDKRVWLQMLGDQIATIFHSDVNEYSKTQGKYIPHSHFENMLAETGLSTETRQAIRDLVLAMNKLLHTYAIDDNYKNIEINVKALEIDASVKSTIQELSEHMDEWFKAYKGKFNNEKKSEFVSEEKGARKVTHANKGKSKKKVVFATEALVNRKIVDDNGGQIGQNFGVEKVKFGRKMPYISLKNLLSKPEVKKTKRRSSTVTDAPKSPKNGI